MGMGVLLVSWGEAEVVWKATVDLGRTPAPEVENWMHHRLVQRASMALR
jgi:hypothetical protein